MNEKTLKDFQMRAERMGVDIREEELLFLANFVYTRVHNRFHESTAEFDVYQN